jgi:hypothetical protein
MDHARTYTCFAANIVKPTLPIRPPVGHPAKSGATVPLIFASLAFIQPSHPRVSPLYAVFGIHSARVPAYHLIVCCFWHTFGPCACAPPHCMLFFAYIRPVRLHASPLYAVFGIHSACAPPHCMLFFAYIPNSSCLCPLPNFSLCTTLCTFQRQLPARRPHFPSSGCLETSRTRSRVNRGSVTAAG